MGTYPNIKILNFLAKYVTTRTKSKVTVVSDKYRTLDMVTCASNTISIFSIVKVKLESSNIGCSCLESGDVLAM